MCKMKKEERGLTMADLKFNVLLPLETELNPVYAA